MLRSGRPIDSMNQLVQMTSELDLLPNARYARDIRARSLHSMMPVC